MMACGLSSDSDIMSETEFYTSHECLLLDYEEALTRLDSTTNTWCGMAVFRVWSQGIGFTCTKRRHSHASSQQHKRFVNPFGMGLGMAWLRVWPAQALVDGGIAGVWGLGVLAAHSGCVKVECALTAGCCSSC